MGTGAEGKRGGWYVDWLVNMLGHWGMMRGCSCWCVVLGVGVGCAGCVGCGGCIEFA